MTRPIHLPPGIAEQAQMNQQIAGLVLNASLPILTALIAHGRNDASSESWKDNEDRRDALCEEAVELGILMLRKSGFPVERRKAE